MADALLRVHKVVMNTPLKSVVESHLGYPRGFWGRYVAAVMNRVNVGITRHILDQLHLAPGQQVLEIGFGGGVSFDLVLPLISGGCLHGFDLSADMLRQRTRERSADIAAGRLELKNGNVVSMPYADASMDRAFAVNVIYFWPEPVAALKELCRVLKPGGRLALGVRSKAAMQALGLARPPFRHYEDDEYRKFFIDAGFSHFEIASTLLAKIETQALIGVK